MIQADNMGCIIDMEKGFKKVEPYYDPVNELSGEERNYAEMTIEESGFLCGLLRDHKPHKIVELGVAAGGTTTTIIRCLNILQLDSEIFSVDLNEKLYSQKEKDTGYIAKAYLSKHGNDRIRHQFLLGQYLPEVLDEIGSEIDFAVLDTVHLLPGELLDFLALLPFLSERAVVVLHDVAMSHGNSMDDPLCFATQVLFASVSADKYLNNENGYPNIAGFLVDHETRVRIADVFSALTLTWRYLPGRRELQLYGDWYHRHYPDTLRTLFAQAIALNRHTLCRLDEATRAYLRTFCESLLASFSHVLLYGAGLRGRTFYRAIVDMTGGVAHLEFVVSSAGEARERGCLAFDEIPYRREETLIVLTADARTLQEKLRDACWHWLEVPKGVWLVLERAYSER